MSDNQKTQELKVVNGTKNVQTNSTPKQQNKCCPFLTLPVMVQKQTMINNKIANIQEPQLRINLCMKDSCALFDASNNKCGLIK